jgi:transcriptional regulator with XRE-family HTH domain
MSPDQIKKIREKIGLTQAELAEILGVSGKVPISHYETGFRSPSLLTLAFLSLLNSLPEKKTKDLIELIREHMKKVKRQQKDNGYGKN